MSKVDIITGIAIIGGVLVWRLLTAAWILWQWHRYLTDLQNLDDQLGNIINKASE